MTPITTALRLYPTFQSLPRGEVEATEPLWKALSLAPGETLWRQGESCDGLAFILRGEVQVVVDGAELGRIGHGGVVGEVSAFEPAGRRSATVISTDGAELAVLPLWALAELRESHAAVYQVILDQSLRALVRRVRAAGRRIASLSAGNQPAPVRMEPGTLARMWRSLVPGTPKSSCPSVLGLLRRQAALATVPDTVLAAIGARFVPQALPEGEVLFLEGEEGGSAWLVAEGQIEILRHVRADRADRIALLGPGDLLGINSLIDADPRTASAVCGKPTWVWKISADALAQLRAEASVPWRECMLSTLAAQIRLAHKAIARVSTGSPADAAFGEDFDRLLHAQGYLEGLPVAASAPFSVGALREK